MATQRLKIGHVKGQDGAQGEPGKTPKFTVSAEASENGEASVTQEGTDEAVTLKFKLPKGEKGEPGTTPELLETTGDSADGAMTQKAVTEALKWKTKEDTLEVGTWGEDNTYSITIDGLTETQIVYITYKPGITKEQLDGFAKSCITAESQSAGSIKLKALTKPSVELPIVILIGTETTTVADSTP